MHERSSPEGERYLFGKERMFRPRPPHWSAWPGLALAAMLLIVACDSKQQAFRTEQSVQVHDRQQRQQPDMRFVGSVVQPSVFSGAAIRTDRRGNYIEIGDMRFAVDAAASFAATGTLWPNGALNYDFAPDVRRDAFKVNQFRAACAQLTANAGIRCLDIRSGNVFGAENHVLVFNSDKPFNYSYVGRAGGEQPIGIVDWNNQVIIAHEIKHALGWGHEHQRPDRDAFVTHFAQNVIDTPENHAQFAIWPAGISKDSGLYDFESMMHYDRFDLSKRPGILKTLEAKPGNEVAAQMMGQRSHFTSIDLSEIANFYGPAGTNWCGFIREPANGKPPAGCFFECQMRGGDNGVWLLCGSCKGAIRCP